MFLFDQDWFSVGLPALALAGVSLLLVIYAYISHNGDILNPVTYMVMFELVSMGLLSAYSALSHSDNFAVSPALISRVLWLQVIYGLTVGGAYLSPINPLRTLFSAGLEWLSVKPTSIYSKAFFWSAVLTGSFVSFILLAKSDPVDLLWLTSPREAYITLRSGYGHWWLLYQSCVAIAFLIALHTVVQAGLGGASVVCVILAAALMNFFTGSKTAILLIPITAAIYHHFYYRRLPIIVLIGLAIMIAGVFALLLGRNGQLGVFKGVIRYFGDYVAVTGLAVDAVDFWGYFDGEAAISSLWYFLPRSLFPEKPFEYGALILHSELFPGMAAMGHTPGILPWLGSYIDFGVFGLIMFAIVSGSFSRAAYFEFTRSRDLGTFLLMMSFCFVPPLASGSPVLYIILTIVLWLILGKSGPLRRSDGYVGRGGEKYYCNNPSSAHRSD